ncbi:probable serine/threonine-protein kinase DDB_G0278845 isoform X2 [Schistocerca gregaria]|uniref:probable serine/threonine-protein kinase DDB_G0278845 isoform X2 n=1 Tax=Schistocerca gregaria TaxID=7010 RepID=UPI00211EB5EC|nr:probable serine/threonine-protein kinase DDB_G0278845 isoform X2 [Schistocerca gregaria]
MDRYLSPLDSSSHRRTQGSDSHAHRPQSSRQTLDDFEIIKKVGQGGFGEVYVVRKKDTDEILALKIISKDLIWKKNKVRQTKNERDVLANHLTCYIVRLMYSFQDGHFLYLAMEYCPGGDLRRLLSAFGYLTEDEARQYMAEIVMATDSLHKLNYVHRDMKPANFLIDASGHLKLTDFGLSKANNHLKYRSYSMADPGSSRSSHDDEKPIAVAGSLYYMSPEVLSGESNCGVEVDWWSVGCIFFELLVGHPIFNGSTVSRVFDAVIQFRTTVPAIIEKYRASHLSEEAADLIAGFLREPQTRLGVRGLAEIHNHPFFAGCNWASLADVKPIFVPNLQYKWDTSYFDLSSSPQVGSRSDAQGLSSSGLFRAPLAPYNDSKQKVTSETCSDKHSIKSPMADCLKNKLGRKVLWSHCDRHLNSAGASRKHACSGTHLLEGKENEVLRENESYNSPFFCNKRSFNRISKTPVMSGCLVQGVEKQIFGFTFRRKKYKAKEKQFATPPTPVMLKPDPRRHQHVVPVTPDFELSDV